MALNRTNLKQTPIPVVSRTMQIVNTDGTVTRSGQLLLQQLQASDALQGTHAGRPAPGDAPDGALYVESDRLVLYSNINGAWHYVAGTMWGTINPDQRPTDLGVNDAGFDFRTVDDPAREFIWSQAYWVEVTPVRYGAHSARLAVSIPNVIDQMLWVETDRGNVTYQLQSHVWHYCSGSMAGTVSPDQRPADLGANDAGFQFESSDTNQIFRWSGTAWVNLGAQGGVVVSVRLASAYTLTTALADVPGFSVTLPRAGTYLFLGSFDWLGNGAGDATAQGYCQLVVNGVAQSGYCQLAYLAIAGTGLALNPTTFRMQLVQHWTCTASGAGQIAKIQAAKNIGTGSSMLSTLSALTALWVSP